MKNPTRGRYTWQVSCPTELTLHPSEDGAETPISHAQPHPVPPDTPLPPAQAVTFLFSLPKSLSSLQNLRSHTWMCFSLSEPATPNFPSKRLQVSDLERTQERITGWKMTAWLLLSWNWIFFLSLWLTCRFIQARKSIPLGEFSPLEFPRSSLTTQAGPVCFLVQPLLWLHGFPNSHN